MLCWNCWLNFTSFIEHTVKTRISAPGVCWVFRFFTRVLIGCGRLFDVSKIKKCNYKCKHQITPNKFQETNQHFQATLKFWISGPLQGALTKLLKFYPGAFDARACSNFYGIRVSMKMIYNACITVSWCKKI